MIEWQRIEAGYYKSNKPPRFFIRNTVYGHYKWILEDYKQIANEGYYQGIYNESTFRDCKLKAEQILTEESGK